MGTFYVAAIPSEKGPKTPPPCEAMAEPSDWARIPDGFMVSPSGELVDEEDAVDYDDLKRTARSGSDRQTRSQA